jgi:LPS-assembly lipoprotein
MNLRAITCLVACLALVGCGFHLRTWNLEGNVETARITANPRNPLAEPLGRALRSAGVTVVEDSDVDVVIELLADRKGRRSVSVTDQARAAEYETSLQVQYAVRDGDGETMLDPTWIRAARVFQVDRNNLVGSSQEQALLDREMVNDLVQQIIRGLNAVTREETGAT